MARQMEHIRKDAQRIASEADSLVVLASPVAESGGNLGRKLRQLQARVDRLRRALWSAQSPNAATVVHFPLEKGQTEMQPSLVDRVLALIDRRCG